MWFCKISLNCFCPRTLVNSLQGRRNNGNVLYRWNYSGILSRSAAAEGLKHNMYEHEHLLNL